MNMRMYDFIDPNGNGCCNLNYPPSSLDIWAPSARLGYIAGFSRSLNNRGVLDFRRPQRIDHTLGVPKDRSNLGYPEALGSPELPPWNHWVPLRAPWGPVRPRGPRGPGSPEDPTDGDPMVVPYRNASVVLRFP